MHGVCMPSKPHWSRGSSVGVAAWLKLWDVVLEWGFVACRLVSGAGLPFSTHNAHAHSHVKIISVGMQSWYPAIAMQALISPLLRFTWD